MLQTKSIAQPILQSCSLLLFAFGGIIVNSLEVVAIGAGLAGIAMLVGHSVPFFQEHHLSALIVYPIVFLIVAAIFLLVALPGFYTVIYLSKLAGQRRILGATILAVTGLLVWLIFGWFFMEHDKWLVNWLNWVILSGFVSNVAGQVLAAILVRRGQH